MCGKSRSPIISRILGISRHPTTSYAIHRATQTGDPVHRPVPILPRVPNKEASLHEEIEISNELELDCKGTILSTRPADEHVQDQTLERS
jgi:hypothetical protein